MLIRKASKYIGKHGLFLHVLHFFRYQILLQNQVKLCFRLSLDCDDSRGETKGTTANVQRERGETAKKEQERVGETKQ